MALASAELTRRGCPDSVSSLRGKICTAFLRGKMPNTNANAYWRMGGITVEGVEDYIYSLLPARDEVLAEMEAEAAQHKIPIIGPAVARVLYQLATISRAKRIFEMGSAIGYSTIWLA